MKVQEQIRANFPLLAAKMEEYAALSPEEWAMLDAVYGGASELDWTKLDQAVLEGLESRGFVYRKRACASGNQPWRDTWKGWDAWQARKRGWLE